MKTAAMQFALGFAFALGALTASSARAESIDVTLEGQVRDLVSQVHEKTAARRHEGFVQGGGFALRFSFDPQTNAVTTARLTDSHGHSWHAGSLDPYVLSAANSFLSASFAADQQEGTPADWIKVSARLDFDGGTFPGSTESRFTAEEHLDALPRLSGGLAQVLTSARCALAEAPAGGHVCTTVLADLHKVTFATVDRAVTVSVPEPAATAMALAGLACAGLAVRRRRPPRASMAA